MNTICLAFAPLVQVQHAVLTMLYHLIGWGPAAPGISALPPHEYAERFAICQIRTKRCEKVRPGYAERLAICQIRTAHTRCR